MKAFKAKSKSQVLFPVQSIYYRKCNDSPEMQLEINIYFAARTGDESKLASLLDKRVSDKYFIKPRSHNTGLHKAAGYGHTKCCEMLITTGHFDIDYQNTSGNTAIHITLKKNRTETFQAILQHSPSLLVPDSKNNYPIHTIAKNLQVKELQEIEKFKRNNPNLQFNPDSTNKHGKTALHLVCKKKNAFIKHSATLAELLLKLGANPNVKDSNNNTPLHYAAAYGGLSVCNVLIRANVDVKALNSEGKSPFDMILCSADLTLTLDETESNFLRSNLVDVLTQQPQVPTRSGNRGKVTVRPPSIHGSPPVELPSVRVPPMIHSNSTFGDVLKSYKEDLTKEIVVQVMIQITTYSPNPRKSLFTSIKLVWTVEAVINHILGVLSISSKTASCFELYHNNNLLNVNAVVSQLNFKAKEKLLFKECK